MSNGRYILSQNNRTVFDRKTGTTWTAEQVLDILFNREPAQDGVSVPKASVSKISNTVEEPSTSIEQPMSRDEMLAALKRAADAEPWHTLQ